MDHEQFTQRPGPSTCCRLQRNLKTALPDLIREAINQHGSMGATFKVYEDLNLVCETLDSLVDTAQQFGKQEESLPLSNDFGDLVRFAARCRLISSKGRWLQTAAEAYRPTPPLRPASRLLTCRPQEKSSLMMIPGKEDPKKKKNGHPVQ